MLRKAEDSGRDNVKFESEKNSEDNSSHNGISDKEMKNGESSTDIQETKKSIPESGSQNDIVDVENNQTSKIDEKKGHLEVKKIYPYSWGGIPIIYTTEKNID